MDKSKTDMLQEAKYDVFISYSRKDYVDEKTGQPIEDSPVGLLMDFLEHHGITYWVDKEEILTGAAFAEKLTNAIRESKMVIFVSSKYSNASVWTAGELFEAFDADKLIIPFRIDDTPYSRRFRIFLAPLDYIDGCSNLASSFEYLLKVICDEKENYVNRLICAESPFFNGHEYIDLGLPSGTLWATCNVGASKPSDYGDYFAWGETVPKKSYDWSSLKYCNDSDGNGFSKYNMNLAGIKDGKSVLELSDDAAHENWGGAWRMPMHEDLVELCEHCDWIWTSQDGCNGYKVTSRKNGASIFLPAAGWRDGEGMYYEGVGGVYWSSSLFSDESYAAFYCFFVSSGVNPSNRNCRHYGLSVRPVAPSL